MHKLLRHGLAAHLIALLLCALVMPAQARVVADLYEVVEAVPSRGATDRADAARRGLERVFVRVTGDAAIGSDPQLRAELQRAQRFLQSYRYEVEENQLYLHLSYDPQAVSERVHALKLPLWPNNRPGTLVWLAADTLQGGRAALGEQDSPELFAALEAMAIDRGLPVDFPAMDAVDRSAMPLGNLWAQDERAAERAGVRYRPDATLMGRALELSTDRWQANWLLIHGGRAHAFDATGNSLEEVAQQGIDGAANMLAQRYAVHTNGETGPQNALVLELSGINEFADYTGAIAYLQGLAQVRGAELLAADNDRLRFSVTPTVSLDRLRDALALNRRLSAGAEEDPIDLTGYRAPIGSAENPLRYRWH
ncbi:DUF2066 domain-containing protein [Microbulbifer guangxiensis]|uniref:DUF2066 domain-containing protein n=1 Tax=Microbulbifer guangxiensis TaxID=2904249 RepID=UPI001F4134C4|nr:DUF2066 domain-containing protein [Microbulbifer guangxiensis]